MKIRLENKATQLTSWKNVCMLWGDLIDTLFDNGKAYSIVWVKLPNIDQEPYNTVSYHHESSRVTKRIEQIIKVSS